MSEERVHTEEHKVPGEKLLGRIGEGACADLVVLDREHRVRLTMVAGRVRFRR